MTGYGHRSIGDRKEIEMHGYGSKKCVAAALFASCMGTPAVATSERWPRLPADAPLGARPSQLARALTLETQPAAWAPHVLKSRGKAGVLYSKVAPATVIVRTTLGHGSGVVIDPQGWILTNAHCVEHGSTDLATGAQQVLVHTGKMNGDVMQLDSEAVPGLVYKKDSEKDLALVRLTRLPEGVKALPAIPLAAQPPHPGTECVVLGHPAAGMLWSVRNCEVASVGMWPREQIDYVFQKLRATSTEDKQKLEGLVSRITPVKIVLSSCGVNPGDSGGPLVDDRGELIALTFAIPASANLDKFAYHIHVDELKAFLAERPSAPALFVPSPWPPAAYTALLDLDEDGKVETLLFGLEQGGPPTGLLADLDESFLWQYTAEQLAGAGPDFKWDFELGMQPGPERRVFYDTQDAGEFDLIQVDADGDGVSDLALRKKDGAWGLEHPEGARVLDLALLPVPVRARGARVIAATTHPHDSKEPTATRGHE